MGKEINTKRTWKKFAGELGRELGGPRPFPSSLATFFSWNVTPFPRYFLSPLSRSQEQARPERVWGKVITRQANVVRAQ